MHTNVCIALIVVPDPSKSKMRGGVMGALSRREQAWSFYMLSILATVGGPLTLQVIDCQDTGLASQGVADSTGFRLWLDSRLAPRFVSRLFMPCVI